MLARSIVRQAVRGVRNVSTKQSSSNGAFNGVYNTFMKSNVAYVSTIIVAAVAVEMVYGTTTSYVWESVNRGRLYHHIDWSQFKTDDDDEEEDDE